MLQCIQQAPKTVVASIFLEHFHQNLCLCTNVISKGNIYWNPPEGNTFQNHIHDLEKKSHMQNEIYLKEEANRMNQLVTNTNVFKNKFQFPLVPKYTKCLFDCIRLILKDNLLKNIFKKSLFMMSKIIITIKKNK